MNRMQQSLGNPTCKAERSEYFLSRHLWLHAAIFNITHSDIRTAATTAKAVIGTATQQVAPILVQSQRSRFGEQKAVADKTPKTETIISMNKKISSLNLHYLLFLSIAMWSSVIPDTQGEDTRPNVIVIMSDDQGGGDYGFMGNDIIRTPELDKIVSHSGLLTEFYVSPVCAPTRASLMTGRYNYRTRCIDTFLGRAMMDPDEITIAEYLRDSGYRTGIYGKWHLGDSYPMRPMDQGFEETLVHLGGGIGQPSDPFGAEGKYTDPTLFKNGVETPMKGYCTDIFFDGAINFITDCVSRDEPFFTYIATNAPHGPFHDVPRDLYEAYKKVDFAPLLIHPINETRKEVEYDKLARIAAMITNIDQNVGKLRNALESLKVLDNTILIYLNDNGPNTMRYVGDMRGMKTNVDDGGIRSPLVFHWPAQIKSPKVIKQVCAHIDVLPTILDACNVNVNHESKIDGRSFLPLIKDTKPDWPDRTLVLQAHRGNKPVRYHQFALHRGPWKLVHPTGFGKESFDGAPRLELYHLNDDPRQKKNLAQQEPQTLKELTLAYDDWFNDVSSTRPNNYSPPRIVIGTEHEPNTTLTRQDWRHETGQPWGKDSNGHWLLHLPDPASFEIELLFTTPVTSGTAHIQAGEGRLSMDLLEGKKRGHTTLMHFPSGNLKFKVDVEIEGKNQGPHQVILRTQQ